MQEQPTATCETREAQPTPIKVEQQVSDAVQQLLRRGGFAATITFNSGGAHFEIHQRQSLRSRLAGALHRLADSIA